MPQISYQPNTRQGACIEGSALSWM